MASLACSFGDTEAGGELVNGGGVGMSDETLCA